MRSVVITGASTGIGWASAKLLRTLDRIIAKRLGLMPQG
jgi:NAD(P)-dependent dehydrogenase (short-subunit alcohol dehydrogenase family)